MSFTSLLGRIPRIARLIGGAIAALTPALLPQQLVPENLSVIVALASLVILLALFVSGAYQKRGKAWRPYLTGGLIASLVLLAILQLTVVESVSPYGPDKGTHRFLTGFRLTSAGEAMAHAVGSPASTAAYIRGIGDDAISRAWGWSHYAAAGLYTLSYGILIFCFVVGICGLEEEQGRQRVQRRSSAAAA
jgi:hypothetical protein